jgi:hypothetical protein
VYIWLTKAIEEARKDFSVRRRLLTEEYNEQTSESHYRIPKGAEITIIPEIDGFDINPSIQKINWLEDWQYIEFRIKSKKSEVSSKQVSGKVSFYIDPILIAQVDVSFELFNPIEYEKLITQNNGMKFFHIKESQSQTAYRKIFVSYSHKDSRIIEKLEQAYQVLGDEYLRDIRILRSGEIWNDKLLSEIQKADIFQLCWSNASKSSKYVEQEWRYANDLKRKYFIRPVYWEIPMPVPPKELESIHFAFLRFDNN